MRYFATYDLRAPGRDYQSLWTALRGLGAVRALESFWWFNSQLSAVQLREYLWSFMDANDRLLVAPLDNWAGYNPMNPIT